METLDYSWKCPNCDSENFNLSTRTCPDCWYCLEHNNVSISRKIKQTKEKISNNFKLTIKKRKIKFLKYESYQVIINPENNKIVAIKYYFKKKRYIVSFFYEITNYSKKEKDFSLPENNEEHIHQYNWYKISINILWIRPKVHTGYWEKIWLNKQKFTELINFIKKVIIEYQKS